MKVVIGTVVRDSFKNLVEKCAKLIDNGTVSFEDVEDCLGRDSIFAEDYFSNFYTNKEEWIKSVSQEDLRYFLKYFGGKFLIEETGISCEEVPSIHPDDFAELFNDNANETFVQFLK